MTIPTEYVYFAQAVNGGPIKIGRTIDLPTRLSELQCGNPDELHYIATVDGGADLEAKLHAHLAPHHLRGEWFSPTQAVREAMHTTGAIGRRDLQLNRPHTHRSRACTNCGTSYGRIKKNGLCPPCVEFEALRALDGDPFD